MSLKLTAKKKINAGIEKVYEGYTKETLLSVWFTTNAKVDLKVGGKYSNADGDEGEYIEILPEEKLVFTWDNKDHCPGTLVEIILEKLNNNSTEVTITHNHLKSENDAVHMKEGWEWSLDSLKSYLETGEIISFENWKEIKANKQ